MRAIVLAYHDIGCIGLEALRRHGFDVAAVFTHRDDPNERLWFGSVAQVATSMGISVHAPEDINHPLWVERIRAMRPDVIFSFYYRRLLGADLLRIPTHGCLNLHGSLLPRYRGRCPINWAIIHGETESGVTLHYMTPRPDDGDIVGQRSFPIESEDDARSVFAKAGRAAEELLDDALPAIREHRAPRRAQDPALATYFGGRGPDDGRIDWQSDATAVRNLVRAVTQPYPGAFSYSAGRKLTVWKASVLEGRDTAAQPGEVLAVEPLTIQCGAGALVVHSGCVDDGVTVPASGIVERLGLARGARLEPTASRGTRRARPRSVLILGANGFIGSALSERLIQDGGYDVFAMDLRSDQIEHLSASSRFHFTEGDISIQREWIEYHVRKCDVVVPLVAIATPTEYVRRPLEVFELDFEENLRIVRYCAKYGRRVVFPSTSEVYGMCQEDEFSEETSRLVLGPIHMQRWIYSSCKQLLDRVIWAYGEHRGLDFTLFRPFNWIGPRLDNLESARVGSSRVVTQLISNLVEGSPILLIDGGAQRRCFTDSTDGIECLYRILQNEGGRCSGKIINVGTPENEASIRELAELVVRIFDEHPMRHRFPPFAGYRAVESSAYYGAGYEDVSHRRPSIKNARRFVGWKPVVGLRESLERTIDFFVASALGIRWDQSAARPVGGGRDRRLEWNGAARN